MSEVQRTLVVLKPDTVGRSIIGEIISRFERAGLHVIGLKMTRPDKDFLYHHYETIGEMVTRRGQKAFDVTLKSMLKSPVVAIALEGVEIIEYVRKIVGSTEPKAAAPGTIRGDYAHISFAYADNKNIGIYNLVHASGNEKEAKEEINHRFEEGELFNYNPIHGDLTR